MDFCSNAFAVSVSSPSKRDKSALAVLLNFLLFNGSAGTELSDNIDVAAAATLCGVEDDTDSNGFAMRVLYWLGIEEYSTTLWCGDGSGELEYVGLDKTPSISTLDKGPSPFSAKNRDNVTLGESRFFSKINDSDADFGTVLLCSTFGSGYLNGFMIALGVLDSFKLK